MLLIIAAAARPITDPDFWWHLRTGQYILETRSIPHSDIFSSIRYGSEWVTHEWLSEVLMYGVYRLAGFAGLIAAFALLISATFYVTYLRAEARAPHPYVAGVALMIGAAATIPTWGVRPQMFSMFFAAVFLFALDKYTANSSSRLIWWLIPLMVLWVNLHAGFAAGLALIVLTILGLVLDGYLLEKNSLRDIWQRTRKLVLLLIGVGAAVCINPNGVRMYSYPFETLRSSSMMQYIQEWRPPNFQDPMFLALLVLIVVLLCAFAISEKPARPSELFMLSATLAATMRSSRNVPFAALIATPILAGHLWGWLSNRREAKRLLSQEAGSRPSTAPLIIFNILLLVGVPIAAAVLRLQSAVAVQPLIEARDFPTAAVQFIEANNVPQPIYNEYHWGGYLIWKLYPSYRVYIDGRADVYGDEIIEDFFKAHDGEMGWREPLAKYGVRTVIVEPNTALASLLRESSEWRNVFEDQKAAVFIRSE
jgi:hypothetical protein